MPLLRGKGRSQSPVKTTILFKLTQLEKFFKAGDTVSLKSLSKLAKITLKESPSLQVKVLSTGKITKALNFEKSIKLSQKASDKILKAGGKII